MVITETSFPRGGAVQKKAKDSTVVSETKRLNDEKSIKMPFFDLKKSNF